MGLLDQAPRLTGSDAEAIARDCYGIRGRASALPSERDQNFAIEAPDRRFVLKIANASESRGLLEAQNLALERAGRTLSFCPRVVPSRDGALLALDGQGHLVRLVTWLPGVPLARLSYHPPVLLEDLGRRLGALDAALDGFDHPAFHREFHWELEGAVGRARRLLAAIEPAAWRATVKAELDRIEARLAAAPAAFRRSVIHNDANDHNVLVCDEGDPWTRHHTVSGLIDFGDMVWSRTVNNVAVAMAYVTLSARDPLAAASAVLRGYHTAHPLDEREIAIAFDLLRLRLCLSAAIAADQRRQRPADEYLTVSQAAIERTLPVLSRIHPSFAEAVFRAGCGLSPAPKADRILRWLAGQPAAPPFVSDDVRSIAPLSLAVDSPLVAGNPSANAEPALTARIAAALAAAGAGVGAGGYLEPRTLYASTIFDGTAGERRTIHLGLDFFAPPGTPVRAPIGGTVYALAHNDGPLDYGPVVILRHATSAGDEFFTLYGHLDPDVLRARSVGDMVRRGDALGAIARPEANGGWPPHLHVQLITDLLDLGCEYPGVCRPSDVETWRALSPDPNLLLKLPDGVLPPPRPDAQATRVRRQARIGRSVRVGYREPLTLVRGWMQYVYDDRGRRYLDAYNNVPHVGHGHPQVVNRVAAQLRLLNTNTRYLHDLQIELAEHLAATLPPALDVCFFVNSGSEANELALRLARAHTGRRDTIVLEAGYHGNTSTMIDLSAYKFDGPGGGGRAPWVHVAPLPDVYRGRHRDPATAGEAYADAVGAIVERLLEDGRGVGAFLAESCPSVGGQIVLPPGYLARAYEHVRRGGGVCIADEVQTAYGRMGTHFYAFEAHGVVPDIVVLGKPIGNGYPLGAVVTSRAIADAFDNGMEFFSTFGGSTAACAAGCAVLDVVRGEALQPHASQVGATLLARLHEIAARHPHVGDVRGSGFFLGVELVTDRAARAPAAAHADYVVNRMRELRVLIGTDGRDHNVLKIRPPMPFDEADAGTLASALDAALAELA